jgi:hypothetical protein
MKKVSFEAFVVLLLCLTVCNIGFCQDKVNAKKFEVEKKYDDKIKKRIKNYRSVELKVSDFKNLVKNKHKYQEGVNVVLNIDGEDVAFRLFENDIIDDDFTLFINGKASKPKKNGVETFTGYAYNNPQYYLRLYISDKIISGYKGLTYGPLNTASFGEAYYDGSGQGTVCKFDAQQLHRAFSMSTVVNNVSKAKLMTDDIYRNICHEIGHTVGAVDLNSGPTDIMTNLLGKSKNFDGSSISLISGYLNSLTCLSTATNLGYNSLFSLKLDGANIVNTPAFVNNGMHSLDLTVTNNNQYLQKTTFTTNNSNVYLYYTSNYGTKFQPNNTSTFSISTSTSNTCYYDFWTTFYALKNGNRIAYPNPSSDNVTIEDPDRPTETLSMKLFNDKGVLIGEYQNENNIKSSDLSNGIYFLHIIHTDNTREVKRIIVNH